MALTYFKRFRMEIDLTSVDPREPPLPLGYHLAAWDAGLLPAHAESKYLSFRTEIDANVFPCLGEYDGCVRLMQEISRKDGFLPGATWLAVSDEGAGEFCGTVQGIRDRSGLGAIQNLGVVPEHRGHGLGSAGHRADITRCEGSMTGPADASALTPCYRNRSAIGAVGKAGMNGIAPFQTRAVAE
jgi:GNAT superfamily N-acetyltransferase